jgi:hypothetical protein
MSSVSALFGAASRLAVPGRRGELAPSVNIAGGVEGVPAQTTMLAGADDPALAQDPLLAGWFDRVVGMLSGGSLDLSAPGRVGNAAVWPVLGEGEGDFDAAVLSGAIPVGTVWVAALHPERFFVQAADRLEALGDTRGVEWAARLRTPTGNLALLGRVVRTMAIALDAPPGGTAPGVLRLRVGCPDEGAAKQAMLLLHAWRIRRGLAEGAAAQLFRASDLVRADSRVELTLVGDPPLLVGLFGRR